jgi:hypothetical protein
MSYLTAHSTLGGSEDHKGTAFVKQKGDRLTTEKRPTPSRATSAEGSITPRGSILPVASAFLCLRFVCFPSFPLHALAEPV